MKSILVSVYFLLAATFFLLSSTAASRGSAEDKVNDAVNKSRAWVAQIDTGKYDDSYTFTCGETRDRFPQDHWVEVLKALRTPWGAVVNREQLSHIYKPNGVPGLNGECVVITYNTVFKHLQPAREVVVLKWEDGKWRGAGYMAGPNPNGDAPPAPTGNSATETHTENHVRPQLQNP